MAPLMFGIADRDTRAGVQGPEWYSAKQVFVARQPILDSKLEVYAYELLYRSGLNNVYDAVSNERATTDVISNTLLTIGMEHLVGGKPAFVNFDRELLLGGLAELLPSKIVIEVLETVTPDAEVISRCRELRRKGFKIALDDVTDEACGRTYHRSGFREGRFSCYRRVATAGAGSPGLVAGSPAAGREG